MTKAHELALEKKLREIDQRIDQIKRDLQTIANLKTRLKPDTDEKPA